MKKKSTSFIRNGRNTLFGLALLAITSILLPAAAQAATSGNATIFNQATVTYDFLTQVGVTASGNVSVAVLTLAAAPTVTVDTAAQDTIQGGSVSYVYTVKANSNGPDTYTLTTPVTSTDTASAFLSSSTNTPSVNSLTLFGGIVVSSGAGFINLPGGSVGANLATGNTVELLVGGTLQRYTVGVITPGNAATALLAETLDIVNLTPIAAAPAITAVNVVAATQVGQYSTLTNVQTAGNLDDPTYVTGTHTVNITLTTTATDAGNAVVTYTTSSGASNQTITTVSAPAITVVKVSDVASAKPGETITYTITVTNTSATTPVSNATITDAVPVYTSYVASSTRLNGITVAGDGDAVKSR